MLEIRFRIALRLPTNSPASVLYTHSILPDNAIQLVHVYNVHVCLLTLTTSNCVHIV